MAEYSDISWTDATFNPWLGCTKVSAACDHCYAESWAKRAGHPELWTGERRRTSQANWRQPYKWNNAAPLNGPRKRVFCASLADVFDNQVPNEWRADLWAMIRETPNLDWLLLTKRPQNIRKMLPEGWRDGWSNVWLGTTVENQAEAERRIPHLLSVRAKVRFLSCEPLLGPVTLPAYGIKWVITGGESGPHRRFTDPQWIRDLRDQCKSAGIAFHHKQNGGLRPKDGGCLIDGLEYKEFPRFDIERIWVNGCTENRVGTASPRPSHNFSMTEYVRADIARSSAAEVKRLKLALTKCAGDRITLHAQIARLRKALEPFATYARDYFERYNAVDEASTVFWSVGETRVTVGDLRAVCVPLSPEGEGK